MWIDSSYRWALGLVLTGLLGGCALPAPALPATASAAQVSQPQGEPPVVQPAVRLPTVTPDSPPTPGPTAEQQALLASLRNYGPAPELHNATWFNGEPLQLASLRGQVVIVEFWTFGCINCQHVIPYTQAWYAKYKDQGLEIIGVHTPEFSYEQDPANVQAAIARLGVSWPVALDNDWATWRAYGNRYWPAAYFIDKTGNVRLLKIGEGQYDYAETVIQALLAEPFADESG
jgi:thiol-disulfide isomerase/thioredoxin